MSCMAIRKFKKASVKASALLRCLSLFLITVTSLSFHTGCIRKVEHAASYIQNLNPNDPLNQPRTRTPQPVRTPLPPPTINREPLPDNYESAEIEQVLPGATGSFDPFTIGQPGSPYDSGKIFAPGTGSGRCGPMDMPMDSRFADPNEKQAVLMIVGNAISCFADIDHDKPGAALTFQLIGAPFINAPWVIVSSSTGVITISNGFVKLRIEYKITSEKTSITKIDYLNP